MPGCEQLRTLSIWSPARPAGLSTRPRDTLFFYAGRIHPSMRHATYLPYYEGPETRHVRAEVLQHAQEPGFKIVNSWTPPVRRPFAGGLAPTLVRRAAAGKAAGKAGGVRRFRNLAGRRLQAAAAAASAVSKPTKVDVNEWMQRSVFCWVPPGQRYGDARRHIISAFHGCIPVFTIPDGHHTLEELVPWSRMSLSVSQEELPL